MGFLGICNNPMVSCTVAVDVATALPAQRHIWRHPFEGVSFYDILYGTNS